MERVKGSLFGLAYGDALGKPTEFLTVDEIIQRYGQTGPRELDGDPALVTDDTQMALAVAWALSETLSDAPALTPAVVEPLLRRRFVAWAHSPDNNRAPGSTCLRAVAGLSEGLPWQLASVPGSKGCGANMRVTPVGLLPGLAKDSAYGPKAGPLDRIPGLAKDSGYGLKAGPPDRIPGFDEDMLANLAQLQAGLTHGHPTALAAAELTAYAVHVLVRGEAGLADLPELLRDRADRQRTVYRVDWLGDLWQRTGASTPEEYIARGWDDCLDVIGRLDAALAAVDRATDPCRQTGAGWIAEEALATALLCALLYADDPVSGLARAATTSGDSDSIACLTGAMLGATHGMEAWPHDWAARIEYADQLAALSEAFSPFP